MMHVIGFCEDDGKPVYAEFGEVERVTDIALWLSCLTRTSRYDRC